jgi:hypothetical protein
MHPVAQYGLAQLNHFSGSTWWRGNTNGTTINSAVPHRKINFNTRYGLVVGR